MTFDECKNLRANILKMAKHFGRDDFIVIAADLNDDMYLRITFGHKKFSIHSLLDYVDLMVTHGIITLEEAVLYRLET